MSDGYDWMEDSNEESVKKAKATQKAQYARRKQKRLWLPVGSEKEFVVIDDTPKMIMEHNPVLNGTRKGNWFTCIKKLSLMAEKKPGLEAFKGGCGLDPVIDAYSIGFVTVLILTPFVLTTGKDRGKELCNYRNLWPLKLNGLEWFNDEKRRRKSLIGSVYAVKRSKKEGEPSYGVPSFIEKVSLDDPKFHMVSRDESGNEITSLAEPLNYGQLLAPLPSSDLRAIAEEIRSGKSNSSGGKPQRGGYRRNENGGGDEGGDDDQGGDDDIPF